MSNLCVNCINYAGQSAGGNHRCQVPRGTNLITGSPDPELRFCDIERMATSLDNHCGEEGKWFIPKKHDLDTLIGDCANGMAARASDGTV